MSQGVHSLAEQYGIMARIREQIPATTLHDGVPDDHESVFDGDVGALQPYMVITFGTVIRSARDRSIIGAAHQPYIQPFTVDCWAGSADDARQVGSAVIETLLGFVPDAENATEIEMSGGGDFRERDTSGRPSRFCKRVQGEFLLNMHTPEV